jgi:hypothetical protein
MNKSPPSDLPFDEVSYESLIRHDFPKGAQDRTRKGRRPVQTSTWTKENYFLGLIDVNPGTGNTTGMLCHDNGVCWQPQPGEPAATSRRNFKTAQLANLRNVGARRP